jgi:hypothetical protein
VIRRHPFSLRVARQGMLAAMAKRPASPTWMHCARSSPTEWRGREKSLNKNWNLQRVQYPEHPVRGRLSVDQVHVQPVRTSRQAQSLHAQARALESILTSKA